MAIVKKQLDDTKIYFNDPSEIRTFQQYLFDNHRAVWHPKFSKVIEPTEIVSFWPVKGDGDRQLRNRVDGLLIEKTPGRPLYLYPILKRDSGLYTKHEYEPIKIIIYPNDPVKSMVIFRGQAGGGPTGNHDARVNSVKYDIAVRKRDLVLDEKSQFVNRKTVTRSKKRIQIGHMHTNQLPYAPSVTRGKKETWEFKSSSIYDIDFKELGDSVSRQRPLMLVDFKSERRTGAYIVVHDSVIRKAIRVLKNGTHLFNRTPGQAGIVQGANFNARETSALIIEIEDRADVAEWVKWVKEVRAAPWPKHSRRKATLTVKYLSV